MVSFAYARRGVSLVSCMSGLAYDTMVRLVSGSVVLLHTVHVIRACFSGTVGIFDIVGDMLLKVCDTDACLLNQVHCLADSWVSVCWVVMVIPYHLFRHVRTELVKLCSWN